MRHRCVLFFLRQRSNVICLASDFFPWWVKIETDRFTAGLGARGLVMCRRTHSCNRTMCRVPRCRVETSKHVTYSCHCAKRKVHCWIRKCKPAQNMNWVQARHFRLASDFCPRWVKIKTQHDSSWTDERRTPMQAAPVLQPRVRRRWQIGKVPGRKSTEYVWARC